VSEWQPIETAPVDGRPIFVWADGFKWPEVVVWVNFSDHDAKVAGEPGYWRFADDLLAEVAPDCGADNWTHWAPMFPPPS
jgi:hypothetical protein